MQSSVRVFHATGAIILSALLPGGKGWSQARSPSLRSFDFSNYTYPYQYPDSWPDHLQWMSLRLSPAIKLVHGAWDELENEDRADGIQWAGLTLEQVQFARISNDRTEDAIVTLRYDSGGTQFHYWVYIYANADGKPKLIGCFHTGDRAYYGLSRISIENRTLAVELFDPTYRHGDCCSSKTIKYRFRWSGSGFKPYGLQTFGPAHSESRIPVSTFGLHQ